MVPGKPLPASEVNGSARRLRAGQFVSTVSKEKPLGKAAEFHTAYGLRRTYISMRLMKGACIHQVADNWRTSVQTIEQFYAVHITDRLDAAAINVIRIKAHR
jgi:hypothetical protein